MIGCHTTPQTPAACYRALALLLLSRVRAGERARERDGEAVVRETYVLPHPPMSSMLVILLRFKSLLWCAQVLPHVQVCHMEHGSGPDGGFVALHRLRPGATPEVRRKWKPEPSKNMFSFSLC